MSAGHDVSKLSRNREDLPRRKVGASAIGRRLESGCSMKNESAAQPGLAISISLRCPMQDREEFIGTAVEHDRKHSISLK